MVIDVGYYFFIVITVITIIIIIIAIANCGLTAIFFITIIINS